MEMSIVLLLGIFESLTVRSEYKLDRSGFFELFSTEQGKVKFVADVITHCIETASRKG